MKYDAVADPSSVRAVVSPMGRVCLSMPSSAWVQRFAGDGVGARAVIFRLEADPSHYGRVDAAARLIGSAFSDLPDYNPFDPASRRGHYLARRFHRLGLDYLLVQPMELAAGRYQPIDDQPGVAWYPATGVIPNDREFNPKFRIVDDSEPFLRLVFDHSLVGAFVRAELPDLKTPRSFAFPLNWSTVAHVDLPTYETLVERDFLPELPEDSEEEAEAKKKIDDLREGAIPKELRLLIERLVGRLEETADDLDDQSEKLSSLLSRLYSAGVLTLWPAFLLQLPAALVLTVAAAAGFVLALKAKEKTRRLGGVLGDFAADLQVLLDADETLESSFVTAARWLLESTSALIDDVGSPWIVPGRAREEFERNVRDVLLGLDAGEIEDLAAQLLHRNGEWSVVDALPRQVDFLLGAQDGDPDPIFHLDADLLDFRFEDYGEWPADASTPPATTKILRDLVRGGAGPP